jgi:hypothetical protein
VARLTLAHAALFTVYILSHRTVFRGVCSDNEDSYKVPACQRVWISLACVVHGVHFCAHSNAPLSNCMDRLIAWIGLTAQLMYLTATAYSQGCCSPQEEDDGAPRVVYHIPQYDPSGSKPSSPSRHEAGGTSAPSAPADAPLTAPVQPTFRSMFRTATTSPGAPGNEGLDPESTELRSREAMQAAAGENRLGGLQNEPAAGVSGQGIEAIGCRSSSVTDATESGAIAAELVCEWSSEVPSCCRPYVTKFR